MGIDELNRDRRLAAEGGAERRWTLVGGYDGARHALFVRQDGTWLDPAGEEVVVTEVDPPSAGFELEEEGISVLSAALIIWAVICLAGAAAIVGFEAWTPVGGAALGAFCSNCLIAIVCIVALERR